MESSHEEAKWQNQWVGGVRLPERRSGLGWSDRKDTLKNVNPPSDDPIKSINLISPFSLDLFLLYTRLPLLLKLTEKEERRIVKGKKKRMKEWLKEFGKGRKRRNA